jgi:hypothetical protein
MTDQAMSPLRRRMIEDMTIRKFAPKTQHDYLQNQIASACLKSASNKDIFTAARAKFS